MRKKRNEARVLPPRFIEIYNLRIFAREVASNLNTLFHASKAGSNIVPWRSIADYPWNLTFRKIAHGIPENYSRDHSTEFCFTSEKIIRRAPFASRIGSQNIGSDTYTERTREFPQTRMRNDTPERCKRRIVFLYRDKFLDPLSKASAGFAFSTNISVHMRECVKRRRIIRTVHHLVQWPLQPSICAQQIMYAYSHAVRTRVHA